MYTPFTLKKGGVLDILGNLKEEECSPPKPIEALKFSAKDVVLDLSLIHI